jgi:hypothetical protein
VNDLEAFARLVGALAPWQSQLVIVGGWAHRLYRHHPLAEAPAYRPLTTLDADVVFGSGDKLQGSIRSALDEAGFKEDLFGNHQPPISQYTLGDEGGGFYAEFLTPLRGSGMKRSGARDATTVAAGISAQKLRNLDILLDHPWQVTVGADQGIPLQLPVELRIANPVGFIAQKFLIQRDRLREKRAQDMLYVHDTLALFGGQLPALAAVWRDQVRPTLSGHQLDLISQCRQENFHAITDTLRAAALIPQDRSLIPERMRAFCEQALDEVLG